MPPRATIAALASGRLPASIAVVRVSGPEAFAAARTLTGPLPPPRLATLRAVRRTDGTLLDRALLLAFPAPGSSTGEDVAEFHLHGGPAVVAAVLDALLCQPGIRLAEPGEFTRRAFHNRRIDLTQAEGLADLLAATTEAQRVQAMGQAEGALADRVMDWRARLLDALARREAAIDFADEGDVPVAGGVSDVTGVLAEVQAALARAPHGERVREGLTVVLAGAPNVGKSSLLNALAGRDAAIVSPRAGTTRDPVEVSLDLDGVAVTLIDTAGLRESEDPIEAEGVARARARAARADLVLALSDDGAFPVAGQRVWTKADLGWQEPGFRDGTLHLSALSGAGVDTLRQWLATWAREAAGAAEPALVSRARQAEALAATSARLEEAVASADPALVAESLRLALRALGRLAGTVDVEDVLDRIFSRFCIGK